MTECLQILEVCKTVGERQDYAFNLTREFARRWQPDHPYPANDRIRPNDRPGTGLQYVSSGGVSNGKKEPPWPLTGTVADGPITWTPEEISFAGLRHRIDSVVWPVDSMLSDAVEIDEAALQEIRIHVAGGTPGVTYTFPALITTTTGEIFEVRLQIEIEI